MCLESDWVRGLSFWYPQPQMLALFYVLFVEQLLQGLYSLWQGVQWLAMSRRHLGTQAGFFTPRVAVICPVRGLEPDLEQNLKALTEFDYAQYEIFFAVATAEDPAFRILERVAAASRHPAHVVRSGRARDCSDKVNNLRAAVEQAGKEFDVLVFTDSDGRPPRRWLNRLVAPLADSKLGAATTFRWLLPRRGGFWSGLVSAWNASAATYLGEHSGNFCWGGGTAIRLDRFEEVRAAEMWHGSVSDDYSLTTALRGAGFQIAFVPECLVASPCEMRARDFFEFTTRQLVITRVYARKLWMMAALAHLFYCAAVLIGLGLWVSSLAVGLPSLQYLVLALVPPLFAALRGVLRLVAALDLLPEWRQKLLAYAWAWTILAPLVPFAYLYNSFAAAFSRKITWRGIRYELVSAGQTRILVR
jgi:cellulose synthase/poly-beta-1,6-N-acetylglucosamine synthase-like glycosyltransferase